jgi:hypothetical protein
MKKRKHTLLLAHAMALFRHHFFVFFLGICAVLLLFSCRKEGAGCFTGAGEMSEQYRQLEDFISIELNDDIDLTIKQGSPYSIRIMGGKNLLEGIETSVSGGWLTLRNNNRCSWMRNMDEHINVEVVLPELSHLKYNGYGNISGSDTLRGQSLTIDSWNGSGQANLMVAYDSLCLRVHTGPFDFHLRGRANYTYIFHAGNGFHRLENLASQYIHAESKATGDIYLWPVQQLFVRLKGEGNIFYKGNPVINLAQESGKGKLLPFYP